MIPKIIISIVTIGLFILMLSCSWSIKRRYEIVETQPSADIAGWKFIPDIQSYHYNNQRGAPADSGDLWLNLTAYHPKVEEGDTLFGVDIDTVYMFFKNSEEVKYTWIKHASAYGDPLEYERLVRRFRFKNPDGSYHFFVPENVDTLFIEFNARFYKGTLLSNQLNTKYSSQHDTVIVDQTNPELSAEKVRIKLIKKTSRTLVPSYL